MDSLSGPRLLDWLADPHVWAAVRHSGVVLLDAGAERILYRNAPAAALLGNRDAADSLPPTIARQVRSLARFVAARGSARAHLNLAGIPVAATLRLVAGRQGAAILLTLPASDAPTLDASRLLAELGLEQAAAAVFASGGLAARGAAFPRDLEPKLREAATLLRDGEALHDATETAYGSAELVRLGDEFVVTLIRTLPQDDNVAEPLQAPSIVPKAEPEGEDDTAPTPAATQSFSLIEELAVSMPVLPSDETEPAAPNDRPDAGDGNERQPDETISVVTLPDIRDDDAPLLDVPISVDDERPGREEREPDETAPVTGDERSRAKGKDAARDATHAATGPVGFRAAFGQPPVRFVWQIDREGRFRSFSPEFAATVGPRAADVAGRSFREVAQVFDFDGKGEIQRLLDRRDTWSGRTVLWPVEGSDQRVPVDLAALPTYARDRSFDGFRGFGIVRIADAETDPNAIGLALAQPDPVAETTVHPDETPVVPAAALDTPSQTRTKRFLTTFEADLPGVSFGRRSAPPPPNDPGRVIVLQDRRPSREATLSEEEEAAFRAIGAELGQEEDAEPPEVSNQPNVPIELNREAASKTVPSDAGAAAAQGEYRADKRPGRPSDFATVFAVLPLPVLIQARDAVVHASRTFLDMAGYGDLDALNAAGGIDALFVEAANGARTGEMLIRRADRTTFTSRVHMQRVPFEGGSALLMSFAAPAAPQATDAEPSDLRRELGELQAVLDTATDGVVLVDLSGEIRSVNGSAHALFGLGDEDVRGRPLAGLFAHESQKTVRDYLEALKNKGLAGVLNDGREVIGRVAQGGFIPLFITVGHLSDERGWCVVIRDIGRWKRVEEDLVKARREAEAASQHKSRFLANISHELRTPLNAIIGFADVIASECFGPIGNERYVEYLGDIKRSGHHVLDLVNDLLDISKIEAGKMELSFEAVSLNEILADVVAVMQPQANRERVIVRSNLSAAVPSVVADRRTIRQIALNLLSNSVRFTPAGGQIIASTAYTSEGEVLLKVRDSGIGMTEREIEIALTPFQQVHKPRTGRGDGTGLGLPLTKAMAEANRASFAIRSAPGEGTLVEIVFPAQRVLAD